MPTDEKVEKARKIADDMFFGPHKPECGIPEDQTMTVRYGNAVRVIAAALEAAEAGAVPVASGDEEAQCYPVHLAWSEEDEAWIATSPDLPGCCAVGESRHAAVREMQDAIFAWIDAAKGAGRSVPKATLSKPPEWARASPPSEASREERAAIRKEAFEEAAKVAEAIIGGSGGDDYQDAGYDAACKDIATAIRARGETAPNAKRPDPA